MSLNNLFQKNEAVIAIIGLSKNSGKTTFLNWLVKRLKNKVIGITTTGRDGEEFDILTNDKKPQVCLPAGTYFTAFDNIYTSFSSHLIGISKLPFRVIDKNLWLYKTLSPIETEIVGPSTRKQQEALIDIFREKGCNFVVIDGSLDRKSICLSDKITDVGIVVGASAGCFSEIRDLVEKLWCYSRITKYKPDNDRETWFLPGMLTDNKWRVLKTNILNFKGNILFNHPLNINIGLSELKRLVQDKNVFTNTCFPVTMVAVNPNSVVGEHIDADFLFNEMTKLWGEGLVVNARDIKNNK